jgi:hypothetical protein
MEKVSFFYGVAFTVLTICVIGFGIAQLAATYDVKISPSDTASKTINAVAATKKTTNSDVLESELNGYVELRYNPNSQKLLSQCNALARSGDDTQIDLAIKALSDITPTTTTTVCENLCAYVGGNVCCPVDAVCDKTLGCKL